MFPIRDTVPSKNPPIATWLIILVNAIVFLLELGMPDAMIERFKTLHRKAHDEYRRASRLRWSPPRLSGLEAKKPLWKSA